MGLKGVMRFLLVRFTEVVVVLLLLIIMPNVPPNAKFSTPYKVTPAMPFEGKLALNEKLETAEIWHKGDLLGPESFAAYNGELYTTIHGGDVVKLTGDHITPIVKFGKPCKGVYEERICGRPLGLEFDKNGALYVSDAYYGIFKVNVKTGEKEQLIAVNKEINGRLPKLPNSIAIASNGDLFWTDSSTEFQLENGIFDMLADGTGRLIYYDAKLKKNSVLIDNLHFANGVLLSDNEEFVIVAETARNRILRYYLKGAKKGTHDVFIDGLPGHPDNLQSDGKGGFLVPLIVAVDAGYPSPFQIFGPFPPLRKLISRILGLIELGFKFTNQIYPNELAQKGEHLVGHFSSMNYFLPKRVSVLQVSKEGKVLDSLHCLSGNLQGISDAFVFGDHLYLGSPFNDYIARVPLAAVGWEHLSSRKIPPLQAQPTTATYKTTTTPTPKPTTAPKVTTTKPTTTPRSTTTSKPTTTTPKPTTTTPKPTTTAPKPTTTASKPTTTAPKPTTTAPKPTTTAPKPTTTAPKPTSTAPKPTTTTPKPTTATPKPVTTTPKPATTTSKPATATTKPVTIPKPVSTPKPSTKQTTTTPKPTTTSRPATTKPTSAQTKKVESSTKPSEQKPTK